MPTNTNTRGHSGSGGSSENCGNAAVTSQLVTTSGHLQPRTTAPPRTYRQANHAATHDPPTVTLQPSPAARRLPPTYTSPNTNTNDGTVATS